MEFYTTDLRGVTRINPGPVARKAIIESVTTDHLPDFPEVFLSIDEGPVLGYRAGGYLSWEEHGEVTRYLDGIDTVEAERIWTLLLDGDRERIEQLGWKPISA